MKIPVEIYIERETQYDGWELIVKVGDEKTSETLISSWNADDTPPDLYQIISGLQDLIHNKGTNLEDRIRSLEERLDYRNL